MAWLVPASVLCLALFFWRMSFRADDILVAILRWSIALVLLGVAVALSIGMALA